MWRAGSESGSCSIFTDSDNNWGNGSQSDRASAAVDAHFGAAKTFDFYKETYGRNGIFGDGRGVPSKVHYGNGYVNAFWDGSSMTYGDGQGNQYPVNMGAALLATIPIAILFFVFQKRFTRGQLAGGVKG